MATKTRDTEIVGEELSEGLAGLVRLRVDTLADAAEVQTALHTLLGYELERSTAELGDEHPRTLALRTTLEQTRDDVRKLEVAREIAIVDEPEVSESGILISGRVTDSDDRGIADLTVCLVDRSDTALPGVKPAETRDDGFFTFAIEPRGNEAARIAKQPLVFVAVFSPRNKLLHREKTGLKLEADGRYVVNVVLDRSGTFGDEKRRARTIYKAEAAPADCDSEGDAVTAVVAAIEQDDDFGDVGATAAKISRRLKELGINNESGLEDFVAGKAREIRDSLRLANLESARVLKRVLRRVLGKRKG